MRHSKNHGSFTVTKQKNSANKEIRSHHTLKAVAYLCAMLGTTPVFAEGEVYNFNISAGDMSAVLSKLAETANVDLNYAASVTNNLKSNGLK